MLVVKLAAAALCAAALSGCVREVNNILNSPLAARISAPSQKPLTGDPTGFGDADLMRAYGAELRETYRTGDDAGLNAPRFMAIEREIEARGLVDRRTYGEIERGVVQVGMPLPQALASVADLVEVDVFTRYGQIIQTYIGGFGARGIADVIVACGAAGANDSKVMTLYVTGFPTPETIGYTYGSQRIKFQTNFPPGYWSDEATINARRTSPTRAAHSAPRGYADRGDHAWSVFSDNSGRFIKPSTHWENARLNPNDRFFGPAQRKEKLCL